MDVGQAKNKLLDFLENNKIYIRNLSHEELKNCVRITIGSTEQMKKVVDVLRKFYSSL